MKGSFYGYGGLVDKIMFVCPNDNCGRSYSLAGLRTHLRYVCGVKPRYKCPYCDYCSKVRTNIRRHIGQMHKGQKTYIVDVALGEMVKPLPKTAGRKRTHYTTGKARGKQRIIPCLPKNDPTWVEIKSTPY